MAFDSRTTAEATSSARLELSIALSDNENTRPLLDGAIQPQGAKLLPTAVHPSEMFWRQLKFGDFDISEMSMSSLTIATSHGPTPWVALPVFTSREFFHTRMLVRADAGLDEPADLRNTRMGVPEYQQTAAIWGRGVLEHEFGVHPREIDWYMERTPDKSHGGATAFTPPPGVRVTQIPPATDIGEMLLRGELHGTLLYLTNRNLVDRSRADLTSDSRFKYLFQDRKAEGRRYFAKTGIYPINHTVVVRRSLLERHPWLALNLYHAFAAARAEVLQRGQEMLKSYDELGLIGAETARAFAFDPMGYGVKANRRVLDTITQYVHEQGLTRRRVGLEELFAPATLDL
jgi:4,5-dihydroxyphthalate decarboxylase